MYSILRLQKIKTRSQLAACQNHNLRLKPVPNADPEKTHLNRTVLAKDYKNVVAEIEDRFQKHNIKPRSDSVQVVEIVLTASHEFFEKLNNEDFREWVQKNYSWAQKEFGKNLLQFTLHCDELTPHIHLLFTPITKDGRLSMKDLYGGKTKLSLLQTRYSEEMSVFGLKRGVKQSSAKHINVKEFYSFINKMKNLNPNQIKEIAKKMELFEKENKTETENTDFEKLIRKIIEQQKPEIKKIKRKKVTR